MKNLQMLIYTKLYKKLCCSLLIICIKKCRRKPNFNNVRAILYAILQLCTQRNFFMRITKKKIYVHSLLLQMLEPTFQNFIWIMGL